MAIILDFAELNKHFEELLVQVIDLVCSRCFYIGELKVLEDVI